MGKFIPLGVQHIPDDIKAGVEKYFSIIRMTWIQALEYKANVVVGAFAIMSGVFIEYFLWKRIFITRGISEINGFTFKALMVYIFLCLIVGQLKSSWVTALEMIDGIREGELNKYLIRPISYYFYHFSLFIGHNSLFYFIYFLMLIILPFALPGWAFNTVGQVAGFLATLTISIYLSYSIYFIMVCISFWFGEARAILIAYNLANLILSGQMIPLRLFPPSMLSIIEMTPLPYLVDVPVSIATGVLPEELWLMSLVKGLIWSVITTIIGFWIYRLGIRRYEGFGG